MTSPKTTVIGRNRKRDVAPVSETAATPERFASPKALDPTNVRLRELVAASGLSREAALELFNVGIGVRPTTLDAWKSYFVNRESARYRRFGEALLEHAEKQLSPDRISSTPSKPKSSRGAKQPTGPLATMSLQWPVESDVGRAEDMGGGHIRLVLDRDNDVCVEIFDGQRFAGVEFCNPGGGGGGRSSRTRLALIALMVAIEADNAEQPALRRPQRRGIPD